MVILSILLVIGAYGAVAFLTGALAWNCGMGDDMAVPSAVFWPVTLVPVFLYWLTIKIGERENTGMSKKHSKELANLRFEIEKTKLEGILEDVTTARLERLR